MLVSGVFFLYVPKMVLAGSIRKVHLCDFSMHEFGGVSDTKFQYGIFSVHTCLVVLHYIWSGTPCMDSWQLCFATDTVLCICVRYLAMA